MATNCETAADNIRPFMYLVLSSVRLLEGESSSNKRAKYYRQLLQKKKETGFVFLSFARLEGGC